MKVFLLQYSTIYDIIMMIARNIGGAQVATCYLL